MKYKVFLSASADEKDKHVVEWFKGLLHEHDLIPIFATEIHQPRPPHDKIKDLIRDANGFVGLLTRREKIQGKDSWKGPDWVQNEVGIAFDSDKQIMMFIEKGVDDKGITKRITDYILFDRNDLTGCENEIRGALKNFRDSVDADYKEHDVAIRKLGDPLTDLEMAIISAGKWLLKKRYNRLDVSLKKQFLILTLVSLIPSYLAYDYFFGSKIIGLYGATLCLVVVAIIYIAIGAALKSRCRDCKSYFSIDEKPLKTSDLKYVSQLIPHNDVVRIECSVCGHFYYGYRPKEERREER
jgi:hypothetical protein